MHRRILLGLLAMAAVGCASGTAGPTFTFSPDVGPLRYEIRNYGSLVIESPMGVQVSDDTLQVTVVLTPQGATADGLNLSAVYEALLFKSRGDMGNTDLEGGSLIGQGLTGTMSESGEISISGDVQIPSDLAEAFDPAALLADLLVPLPPGGETDVPWPVDAVVVSHTAMTVTSSFEGTARLAGDTVWNGRAAHVILVEGTMSVEGKGMPAGVPAEISMSLEGTSTGRYVWDPQRGVMLAAVVDTDVSGTITLEGLDMDILATTNNRQIVDLKP